MKPTRNEYLAFAKAPSEEYQVQITNTKTQETYFEDQLGSVELNTIYMMVVSRDDHKVSKGYLILVDEVGEVVSALDSFLDNT